MVQQLLSVTDVAELLGVSKSRASQLVRQKGFPREAARLGNRPGWRRADVERWAREHGYPKQATNAGH